MRRSGPRSRHRVRRFGFLVLVLACVAAACGGEEEFPAGPLGAVEVPPGESIHIRSLNSISGDFAFLGLPNQRGAELAIADYGPVAGRSVSMGSGLDDLCSPDGGQAAAQAVVADPQAWLPWGMCEQRRASLQVPRARARDGPAP